MKLLKAPVLVATLVLAASLLQSATPPAPLATRAPALIELHDQYDAPQRLVFPGTNVTLLTIADKKGSDQIDGWIQGLKPGYASRVDIRGLADCGGAPGFIRGTIRRKFQETRKYPVMLDWTGKVCAQIGYRKQQANVLVLGRDGSIQARFSGEATPKGIAEAIAALDKALAAGSGAKAEKE